MKRMRRRMMTMKRMRWMLLSLISASVLTRHRSVMTLTLLLGASSDLDLYLASTTPSPTSKARHPSTPAHSTAP